jgi:hypothetical protein
VIGYEGTLLVHGAAQEHTLCWAVLLTVLFYASTEIWGYFFALLIAYLIADLVKQTVIAGSRIYSTYKALRLDTEAGYGFLAFFAYIIVGALASAFLGKWFTAYAVEGGIVALVVTNVVAILLLYADYYITKKT